MSFLADLIKIVDDVTDTLGLQTEVTHFFWVSQQSNGAPNFSPSSGTKRKAAVDMKPQIVQSVDGRQVSSRATLTFPRPVLVTVKDEFRLPDGSMAQVVAVGGFVDPETNQTFTADVFVG